MSLATVRPAHATRSSSLLSVISWQILRQSSNARLRAAGQSDVGFVDADLVHQMHDASLSSTLGSVTDGFCSPSRSVSSKNSTFGRNDPTFPRDLVPVEDEVVCAPLRDGEWHENSIRHAAEDCAWRG